MSYTRQNYDNGHDIASSIEKGEACDFPKEMPKIKTPKAPSEAEIKKNPNFKHNLFYFLSVSLPVGYVLARWLGKKSLEPPESGASAGNSAAVDFL